MSLTALKLEKHKCNIICPDGMMIHADVTNLTQGSSLFKFVCDKVGINEACYFGLKYKHHKDGKDTWLNLNRFLGKQLHTKIYTLQLRTKFWPPFPSHIKENITRYHMVLDVSSKIRNGELKCSLPIQALLASYLVQSEFNDYYNSLFTDDNDLKEFSFFNQQPADFLHRVEEFHMKHKGLSSSDADRLYMDAAKKIQFYGIDFHDVMDGEYVPLLLGVNYEGVHIYRNSTLLNLFPWCIIKKIDQDLKKKILSLHIRTVNKQAYQSLSIGFFALTKCDLKRIYHFIVQSHKFFSGGNTTESICGFHNDDLTPKQFVRNKIIRQRHKDHSSNVQQPQYHSSNVQQPQYHSSNVQQPQYHSSNVQQPHDVVGDVINDEASSLLNDTTDEQFDVTEERFDVTKDLYEPMKMKYPSSNLTEPTLMEEKCFHDLCFNSTTSHHESPLCVENTEQDHDELYTVVDTEGELRDSDKIPVDQIPGVLVPDGQILVNQIPEGQNLDGQIAVEQSATFDSNVVSEDKATDVDVEKDVDKNVEVTFKSSSDIDVDLDTVVVETEEVTNKEVDPDTQNVVLVTHMVVTEIESSICESSGDESQHDASASSVTTLTVTEDLSKPVCE